MCPAATHTALHTLLDIHSFHISPHLMPSTCHQSTFELVPHKDWMGCVQSCTHPLFLYVSLFACCVLPCDSCMRNAQFLLISGIIPWAMVRLARVTDKSEVQLTLISSAALTRTYNTNTACARGRGL